MANKTQKSRVVEQQPALDLAACEGLWQCLFAFRLFIRQRPFFISADCRSRQAAQAMAVHIYGNARCMLTALQNRGRMDNCAIAFHHSSRELQALKVLSTGLLS